MTLKQYKKTIEGTKRYPEIAHNFGIAYLWLGLIQKSDETYSAYSAFYKTEIPEYRVELIEKVGDICWYICNIADEVGLNVERIFNPKVGVEELKDSKTITSFCKDIQNYYHYDKRIIKKDMEKTLSLLIVGIVSSIKRHDISLEEVLENNSKRYGRKD